MGGNTGNIRRLILDKADRRVAAEQASIDQTSVIYTLKQRHVLPAIFGCSVTCRLAVYVEHSIQVVSSY